MMVLVNHLLSGDTAVSNFVMNEGRDIAFGAIMVSVAVAILGVAVPLTHNTINNTSRRFNSDVMAKLLKKKVLTTQLVCSCIAVISFGLLAHFLSVIGSQTFYVCSFGAGFVSFACMMILFFTHIRRTMTYLVNPNKLAGEAIDKIKKEIFSARGQKES